MKFYFLRCISILFACLNFACSKDEESPGFTRESYLAVSLMNLDNSEVTPEFLEVYDTVKALSYGIAADIKDTSIIYQVGSSLEYGSASFVENPIRSVEIITLKDFDDQHVKGSSVNDLFKVRPGVRRGSSQLSNAKPVEAENFGSVNDLLLYATPGQPAVFQFLLKITLSSGKILADTTEEIYLEK